MEIEVFYVYEPRKSRPRSQAHSAHLYGEFYSYSDAEKWIKEKGLEIYPDVKIVQLTQENHYPHARVVKVK